MFGPVARITSTPVIRHANAEVLVDDRYCEFVSREERPLRERWFRWGSADEELVFEGEADALYHIALEALERVGRVSEHDGSRFIVGRTRFGLQRVSVKIFLLSGNDGRHRLRIEAFADDIWGGGARMGIKKLVREIRERADGAHMQ